MELQECLPFLSLLIIVSAAFIVFRRLRHNSQSPRVTGLFFYPIKSCGPLDASALEFDRLGVLFDRRWLVINAEGRFVTAREQPRLVLVQPALADQPSSHHRTRAATATALALSAPGMPPLRVPPIESLVKAGVTTAKVWDSELTVSVYGEDVNRWFSEFLSVPVRLVTTHEADYRRLNSKYDTLPHEEGIGVAFADAFPLLVVSEESLAAVQRECPEKIEMLNFRPNIVVKGVKPFEEDKWLRVRIGNSVFNVVKPCSRCLLTTVNPRTGQKSKAGEPLITLRRVRATNPFTGSEDGKCYLGVNMVHAAVSTRVAIGDVITVLERRAPPPPQREKHE